MSAKIHVTVSNGLIISGLNDADKSFLKKSLTFDNPVFEKVKKYSRYSYTTVPPYLTYYTMVGGVMSVPIGTSLHPFNPDFLEIQDERIYKRLHNIPEFVLTLRKNQEEAANAYINANTDWQLNGCIQMPTAKGKSILGLYLAYYYKAQTLIVVHKDDLVRGWLKDIDLAFDGKVKPGIIKANKRVVGDFITIATIQTLNHLTKDELQVLYDTFGLVIQDEMHHCPSSSFKLVSYFKSRYKLGLTATPERSDGLAHIMNLYFGGFAYRYGLENVEKDEDISPVEVIVRNVNFGLFNPLCMRNRKKNKFLYEIAPTDSDEYMQYYTEHKVPENCKLYLDLAYNMRPEINYHAVDNFAVRNMVKQVCRDIYTEYKSGHSCVAFFTQKEHCRLYESFLCDVLKVPKEHIGLYYGDNSNNEEVLKKAETQRQYITLTTYAKTNEGTNVKMWEVGFLVSSLNNGKNVEQAAGRIRRIKSDKLNPVRLYDYRNYTMPMLRSHGITRDKRYQLLKFTFKDTRAMFNIGL